MKVRLEHRRRAVRELGRAPELTDSPDQRSPRVQKHPETFFHGAALVFPPERARGDERQRELPEHPQRVLIIRARVRRVVRGPTRHGAQRGDEILHRVNLRERAQSSRSVLEVFLPRRRTRGGERDGRVRRQKHRAERPYARREVPPPRLPSRFLPRAREHVPAEGAEARDDAPRGARERVNLRVFSPRRRGVGGGVEAEEPVHRARRQERLPPPNARGDAHGVRGFAVAVVSRRSKVSLGLDEAEWAAGGSVPREVPRERGGHEPQRRDAHVIVRGVERRAALRDGSRDLRSVREQPREKLGLEGRAAPLVEFPRELHRGGGGWGELGDDRGEELEADAPRGRGGCLRHRGLGLRQHRAAVHAVVEPRALEDHREGAHELRGDHRRGRRGAMEQGAEAELPEAAALLRRERGPVA